MENIESILIVIGVIVGAVLFIKLLSIPMKLIVKLLLNALSGFVMLFIFNFIAQFAGFSLSITPLSCIIAGILTSFADIPAVKSAFAAIRVGVCVLIFNSVTKLWKKAVIDKATLAICVIIFILAVLLDVSPAVYVVICCGAGILLTRMGVRGK